MKKHRTFKIFLFVLSTMGIFPESLYADCLSTFPRDTNLVRGILTKVLQRHVTQSQILPEHLQRASERILDILDPYGVIFSEVDRREFRVTDRVGSIYLKNLEHWGPKLASQLLVRGTKRSEDVLADLNGGTFPDSQEILRTENFERDPMGRLRVHVSEIARNLVIDGVSEKDAWPIAIHRVQEEIQRPFRLTAEDLFLKALLPTLDPLTQYHPSSEVDSLSAQFVSKLASIQLPGVALRIERASETFVVTEVNFKGQSSSELPRVGDRVIGVNGHSFERLTVGEMNRFLNLQRRSSEITLDLNRDHRPLRVRLKREETSSQQIEVLSRDTEAGKISVIGFRYFSKGISDKIRATLLELMSTGSQGLILDLRDNRGGNLGEARNVINLFTDAPMAGAYLGKPGREFEPSILEPGKKIYDHPVLVLVNSRSASAAEFVAASLRDLDRAVIVGGVRTFGKGSINEREIFESNPDGDLGGFSVSSGFFVTSRGRSVQQTGVPSDIVIPGPGNPFDSFFLKDLPGSLPPPVADQKLDLRSSLDGLIAELKMRSTERVQANADLLAYAHRAKVAGMSPLTLRYQESEGKRLQLEEAVNVLIDFLHKLAPFRVETD